MTPEELVDLVDFRYLTDALTRDEALAILRAAAAGRDRARGATCSATAIPAYTTTPGLARLRRRQARRGCAGRRSPTGSPRSSSRSVPTSTTTSDGSRSPESRGRAGHRASPIDANQRWDVDEAVEWIAALARFDLAWVEEPTSPDDILGHAEIARQIAPMPVATGEHMQPTG